MRSPGSIVYPRFVSRPPPIALPGDEVHVWLADLSAPDPGLHSLSQPERQRAARFIADLHRRRYVIAHHALRLVLASYLDAEPSAIDFETAEGGKPFLPGHPFRFNLSHSGDLALIGLAREREIGIDIEAVRSSADLPAVARRFFAPAEVAALERRPEHERLETFFRIWTRKEAYIKALGGGLAIPLDSFEVSLDPGHAALLRTSASGSWSMRALDTPAGHAAAVVVEGPPFTLRQFRVSELGHHRRRDL